LTVRVRFLEADLSGVDTEGIGEGEAVVLLFGLIVMEFKGVSV
jgi:hypothetical protein